MTSPADLAQQLRDHLDLYRRILDVVDQENQTLRQTESSSLEGHRQARIDLLPSLIRSLDELKALRQAWQTIPPADRARCPEVSSLLRQSQDVVMKVILLDRENEQCLLRRGLFPAREISRLQTALPHLVAERYSRQPSSIRDHAV